MKPKILNYQEWFTIFRDNKASGWAIETKAAELFCEVCTRTGQKLDDRSIYRWNDILWINSYPEKEK